MRLSDSSNSFQLPHSSNFNWSEADGQSAIAANASAQSPATSDWQSQLLPLSVIQQESDIAVLKEQLDKAHRLLQEQQTQMVSEQKKLGQCQTQLVQTEQDLEVSQKQCARQSAKVEDVKSVCHDLRSQLQRQQVKMGEYQQAIQQSDGVPISLNPTAQSPAGVVTLGYDAFSDARADSAAKASPVQTWSANPGEPDLSGSLALYRKLAAMTVAAASHHSRVAKRYGQRLRQPLKSANAMVSQNLNASQVSMQPRVELPSFI